MINRLSHACIWVLDQDEALAFYTGKLGFEVRGRDDGRLSLGHRRATRPA